jgi:hypothetical protein
VVVPSLGRARKGYTIRHDIPFCVRLVRKDSARRVGLSHLTRDTVQDCLIYSILLSYLARNFGDSHDLFKAEDILELPRNPKPPVVVFGVNVRVCCFSDVSWPSTWVFWSLKRRVNPLCRRSSHKVRDTKLKGNIAEPTCTMFGAWKHFLISHHFCQS